MTTHNVTLTAFARKLGQYTIRVLLRERDRVLVTDSFGNGIQHLYGELSMHAMALSTEVAMWRRRGLL